MPRNIKATNRQAREALASGNCYAPLLILPTSTPPETVNAVRAAGYVPVMTDEPDKVKLVLAGGEVSGGDLLMSALHGLCSKSGYGEASELRSAFVLELQKRLNKREGA